MCNNYLKCFCLCSLVVVLVTCVFSDVFFQRWFHQYDCVWFGLLIRWDQCNIVKVPFWICFKLFYQSIAHVWADISLTRPTNTLLDPGFTLTGRFSSVRFGELRHFRGFFTLFWMELNVEACNNSYGCMVTKSQTSTQISQTDQWNTTHATSFKVPL